MAESSRERPSLLDDLLRSGDSVFLAGAWHKGHGAPIDCMNPTTDDIMGSPLAADGEQLHGAVGAARHPQSGPGVSGASPH
jgi:hypothetical protein